MNLEFRADRETLVKETFEESEQPIISWPSREEVKRVFVDGYYAEIARKAEIDRIKLVAMGKMKSDPVFDPEPSIKQAA